MRSISPRHAAIFFVMVGKNFPERVPRSLLIAGQHERVVFPSIQSLTIDTSHERNSVVLEGDSNA